MVGLKKLLYSLWLSDERGNEKVEIGEKLASRQSSFMRIRQHFNFNSNPIKYYLPQG